MSEAPATPPSPTPLLEVDKLTLRFRGLTAVKEVSLSVHAGEIVAVIGPNGAGKTSLFNAITGIYEPNEGEVRLDGRDLRAPLTRAHYLRWGLLGVAVGMLMYLFIADVDRMWAAVVKPNFRGREQGFQFAQAGQDLVDYVAARPRVELRTGRFTVVTLSGAAPFGSSRTREEALARRDAVVEMGELGGQTDTIAQEQGGAGWEVKSRDGTRVLDKAPSRAVLEARVQAAQVASDEAASAQRKRLFAFLLGLCVGAGGGYTIWRQTRRTPSTVAARGVARTFQNIRLFQGMTVLENVLVGMDRHLVSEEGWLSRRRLMDLAAPAALLLLSMLLALVLRFSEAYGLATLLLGALTLGLFGYLVFVARIGAFSRHDIVSERRASEQARELLAFVGLEQRASDLSRNLAYGDQRRLEIARALATRPRLLLLDEPAAGMNPSEAVALTALIRRIREQGTTVLLIEHHMRVVMGISDRIVVLQHGQKIAEGAPEAIRSDARVIEAYLGKEDG